MNVRAGLLAAVCALLPVAALLAADIKARTADGKEVILHDDGTWEFAAAPKGDDDANNEYSKDADAELAYTSKKNVFALHLVPDVWKKSEKTSNASAEVEFVHKDGEAMAMIIAERISIPLDTLKKAALQNMRNIDKEAKVLKEEKRKVNGAEVLCLVMQAKPSGVPITYQGYYYSGKAGSIQILTWTGDDLFKEMQPDMEKFLNGFEVLKK